MKGKWVKDYCPYAKDQGFDSVIGDVALGESIFGFQYLHPDVPGLVNFALATNGKVHQMADARYRVLVTRSQSSSYGPPVVNKAYVYGQYADHFHLAGDAGEWYDIVVIGIIAY